MAVVGRPPLGTCPNCGEHRALSIGNGRRRCRNCERVWTPDIATDGGVRKVRGPRPTEVSVHPEECKQMRRLSRRGPDAAAIAGLFDIPVGVVEYHLSSACGCPDNERASSGVAVGGESA